MRKQISFTEVLANQQKLIRSQAELIQALIAYANSRNDRFKIYESETGEICIKPK